MAAKDDKGDKDVEDVVDDAVDDVEDDADDADAANWERLGQVVGDAVDKRMKEWESKQRTTSSRSPRKAAPPKKPVRKQGFLSGQFFSNLNPTDDAE